MDNSGFIVVHRNFVDAASNDVEFENKHISEEVISLLHRI